MELRVPRDALAASLPVLLLVVTMVHAIDAREPCLEMVVTTAASGGGGAGLTGSMASCASWRLGMETRTTSGAGTASPPSAGATSATTCSATSSGRTARWRRARPPPTPRGSSSPATAGRSGCSTSTTPPSPTSPTTPTRASGIVRPRPCRDRYDAPTLAGTVAMTRSIDMMRTCRAEPYNATYFDEYVANATAPPLPEVLELYEKLLALGIKVVFITGRHEYEREPTIKNLRSAGYHTWEKLVLKPSSLRLGSSLVPYKSGERRKLVDTGHRIVGNMGDQWSDLVGAPEGDRTFKVPDPMYYVG